MDRAVQRRALLFSVPFGGREISTQLFSVPAWAIPRRVALNAPSLLERSGVHRIESELVEQPGDGCLRSRIVAGYHQCAAIGSARRQSVSCEFGGVDVVEGLDDL